MRYSFVLAIMLILCIGCSEDADNKKTTSSTSLGMPLLELRKGTNIDFNNLIEENLEFNTITNDAILQGAGVGIIDVNNDGLQDIYFAGNMVTDKLYINEGEFKFKDISAAAGIDIDTRWSTGVSIVDINNDGYQDIYVNKYLFDNKSKRKNLLYINNKDNTFSEKSSNYGLDDTGYSIMTNFFDYDGDGDLDAYIANQPPYTKELRKKLKPTDYQYTDRLLRNDGNTFVDVTIAAGLQFVNYSLSATVNDFNNDGLPDIYVTSDYEEPDLLYQNNGDGTFKNIIYTAVKHMSNFSMGVDVADINNDGHMDIFSADMTAEDNFRSKTNMASMNIEKFWSLVNNGYHYQYMFNSMQLNNGNGTFSEIAQMSGISKTDWSWAPLFIDADQDGYKDLFVTNGILKEIRNKDYSKKLKQFVEDRKKAEGANVAFDPLELSKMAPSLKIKNKAYLNNGDLTFSSKADEWGFGKPGWTHGMAYADFDNDGDLDLVLNNMNEKADIYENHSEKGNNKSISVSVKNVPNNSNGLNTKVKIEANGQTQIVEITPFRGFMSSCEAVAHFGVGTTSEIDKLTVEFPDGKTYTEQNLKTNQKLVIDYTKANGTVSKANNGEQLFSETNKDLKINYIDNEYLDYKREVLIPYKASMLGPFMTKGDVNGDGNEDFYLGGAIGSAGQVVLQKADGTMNVTNQTVFDKYKNTEDGGALFVDIDGDNDLDLYVCGGGSEYVANTAAFQDRLLLNDGAGNFSESTLLPQIYISSSSVSGADYDNDGDIDLFVGGRQSPGKYGQPVSSKLLRNDGDKFVDVSPEIFNNMGMVTGSAWADIDGDKTPELVTCGEWMSIQIFRIVNGTLELTNNNSLQDSKGLWSSIKIADIDNDGDQDIIAGNHGLNYKYKVSKNAPLELYVNDFDKNGSNDVYLGYHDESDGKLYPVRGKQCSSEQMPFVNDKFENYEEFGHATVIDVLDGKLEGSTKLKVNTLAHTVYINDGSANFTAQNLPNRSQVSPFYDMVVEDFNNDGHLDILGVGNFHQREVETTRSDAGIGSLLLGNKNGSFTVAPPKKTGILADKDVRSMALLNRKNGKKTIAIANNGDRMQFYELK